MKRALDLDGNPHSTVLYIENGVAAGWRVAINKNGTLERLSARELQLRLGVNPWVNVNPCSYRR